MDWVNSYLSTEILFQIHLITLVEIVRAGSSLALSFTMLAGLGVATWIYIVVPFHSTTPPKPMYANDYAKSTAPDRPKFLVKTSEPPKPKLKPTAAPKVDVQYEAKVNSSIGLVLRTDPSPSGKKGGGVDFNAKVEILKESPDREWVYIRQAASKEEGWVRSGNLTRR